jgi:hypothetical protein
MNPDTYPDDIFQQQLRDLSAGEVIWQTRKEEGIRLTYNGVGFDLDQLPGEKANARSDKGQIISSFDSLNGFWEYLTDQEKWTNRIKGIWKIHPVLTRYVLRTHNQLVYRGDFTYDELLPIHGMVNKVYDHNTFSGRIWQFCPHCRSRVMYYPRYPKYLCGTCQNLPKVNGQGDPLEIHPLNEREGFKVITRRPGQNPREYQEAHRVTYWLSGRSYAAAFTRFGGLIHAQLEGERYYLV